MNLTRSLGTLKLLKKNQKNFRNKTYDVNSSFVIKFIVNYI